MSLTEFDHRISINFNGAEFRHLLYLYNISRLIMAILCRIHLLTCDFNLLLSLVYSILQVHRPIQITL